MACNFEENKFIKFIECTVREIKADYYRKQMISALKRIREYTRRDESELNMSTAVLTVLKCSNTAIVTNRKNIYCVYLCTLLYY